MKSLSIDEQHQAVWVDLESTGDGDVSLIGIGYWVESDWTIEQLVIDARLARYTSYGQSKGQPVRQLTQAQALRHLDSLLGARSRLLVAFTSYENDKLPELAEQEDVDLTFNYCDAHKIGKAWAKRTFPKVQPRKLRQNDPGSGYSIDWFAKQLDIEVPSGYGPGHTSKRLKELREAEVNNRAMTAVRKAKWTKLLGHNLYDIEVMRDLVTVASK